MPLFVCEKCKNIENTALSRYWSKKYCTNNTALCSECDSGEWHGKFQKEKFDETIHNSSDYINLPFK